ncbi:MULTISPECIES: RdgB/HAM1 family non-canonical purine NTP pyrophosphatase [Prochlorococcus]|uniref:dITP/XTP pyrophosphatase n=1 Tax=Prochlorococcus marinus (strain SARG / CCMP1375 / SS120) TaxID=167539 RepID=IXTPA_PROMA|nr:MULTISPECIES: RdgB/HAM1 family non-canonical purine NTP pyrophosphatase [Prochlorococcus]Q7VDQ7.1 RecName: Full=dITP/XTP pyrophosphatase; AltName: Full=Non-canonical purine NTP pyrophosphatase; AltName: Full=Non-standard purine NTP pyrophosphatase; AltName: Full=Nucleoside-triphosphate diphosphatase; AltName: Full=Nucleoside-triphosphate pyrophosphatase; Short=NTPase [Prochlorococcus marinus subsp. marinus str. CCMP1375]AAP99357.1 Xanthosine triphosphate pyrophosphatase [Prochlorococcus marinu
MSFNLGKSLTKLIIASNNDGKIEEFIQLLSGIPLVVMGQPKHLEVEETGVSFAENARIKAIAVAKATGEMALADDSGLSVGSLGGAPGVFSARYANTDLERVSRLLKELEMVDDRSAFFSAALCLASSKGEVLLELDGRCDGIITTTPRGKFGFGYDPIFEVKGTGLTFSEMDSKQKRELSHRGLAVKKLIPSLKKILDS